ncbi:hypothetical protein [Panacagrimonas sp.]|uniref:hypothetical protein n=1 Tax=Panacagrimonas sp. TaxID=2480088 RepID=UPI003B5178DF
MNDLKLQAEHLKLARLLGCKESQIAALKIRDVDALRQLRAACTSTLFDGDRASLQKVVAAARLMPAPLNALIAEKAMGPVLGSRVAGMLPPQLAVDIAKRAPLALNVEVTLLIDPRSAVPMLRLMPVELVVAVTREVVKRREYIAMARFVDTLTNEQIRACMQVLDDEAMLRIGFFVESPQRLEEVVGLMNDERLQKVMAVGAKPELDLGAAVLMLLSGVGDKLRTRLAEAALSHPDAKVGDSLIAVARQHGMVELLAPLGAAMKPAPAQRLRDLLAC